jgi:hypothetical protein
MHNVDAMYIYIYIYIYTQYIYYVFIYRYIDTSSSMPHMCTIIMYQKYNL